MVAAIRTVGLAKSFGATVALRPLDLEVAGGRGAGLPGAERRGQDDHDPAAAGDGSGRLPGARRSSGWTASAQPVAAHRRSAYVPGEANLWPSLTGGETLHLLGRVQGRVDAATGRS